MIEVARTAREGVDVMTNLVARFFNFGPAVLFEVTDAVEREAPKVQF